MSEAAAVMPDAARAEIGNGTIREAVDCAARKEFAFSYHNDNNGR